MPAISTRLLRALLLRCLLMFLLGFCGLTTAAIARGVSIDSWCQPNAVQFDRAGPLPQVVPISFFGLTTAAIARAPAT